MIRHSSHPDRPAPRILLAGAGHAHLLALPLLRKALPNSQITLIEPAEAAIYSGMSPGLVAGHYAQSDLSVDLAPLGRRYGIRTMRGKVTGLDPLVREVSVDGPDGMCRLPFDLASLDIGSHTAMHDVEGFASHGVAVKPLGGFAARLSEFMQNAAPASPVAIIGGGVAGVEISLAIAHRHGPSVSLIEAGPQIAASLGQRARRHLIQALDRFGVQVVTGRRVACLATGAVVLDDGSQIPSDLTIGAAGARAHGWLSRDLPTDAAGFVHVDSRLQVLRHPRIFASGDCAAMLHAPRPKAGVFAVRQGPVLARNLVAAARDAPLEEYHPQGDYLKIISLGERDAVAQWHGLTLQGRWIWQWKDRIDRRFIAKIRGR